MHDVNLKSMFHTGKAVLPHMIEQQSGKIVNISSVTFHLGVPGLTHYVSSKGGVIGFTRSLAREMGPQNIHVNCVTPGAIHTKSEATFVGPDQVQVFVESQSLRRRIEPLDVATRLPLPLLRPQRRNDRPDPERRRRLGHALGLGADSLSGR